MKEPAWTATHSLWTLLPPSWVTKFNFQLSSAPEPLPMPLPLPLQWQACPMLQVATEQPSSYSCSVGFGPELPSFWVQCWDWCKAQGSSDLGVPEQHRPLRPKTENHELCKTMIKLVFGTKIWLIQPLFKTDAVPYIKFKHFWGKTGRDFSTFWDHSFLLSQLQNYSLLLQCFPTV